MAERARQEAAANRRGTNGSATCHTRTSLPSCRAVGWWRSTSLSEGGPAVIPEAIVAGVPVIASRVAGCVGMLGDDYPGLFPPGDTRALARLFCRAERERGFYQSLREACDRLRPLFRPEAERRRGRPCWPS